MAIMRTGPGKRTKTATTKKVTTKDVVSSVKNMFSGFTGGAKKVGKAKGPGALAGVASRAGGVSTLTSAKVTGSKKAGIQGLKAKKKSGEMSRAEANAKIKALKGKAQPTKKESYTAGVPLKGIARSQYAKPMPSDSATFMNLVKKSDPGQYDKIMSQMKAEQAKNPGARFKFSSQGISVPEYKKVTTGGGRVFENKNTSIKGEGYKVVTGPNPKSRNAIVYKPVVTPQYKKKQ